MVPGMLQQATEPCALDFRCLGLTMLDDMPTYTSNLNAWLYPLRQKNMPACRWLKHVQPCVRCHSWQVDTMQWASAKEANSCGCE